MIPFHPFKLSVGKRIIPFCLPSEVHSTVYHLLCSHHPQLSVRIKIQSTHSSSTVFSQFIICLLKKQSLISWETGDGSFLHSMLVLLNLSIQYVDALDLVKRQTPSSLRRVKSPCSRQLLFLPPYTAATTRLRPVIDALSPLISTSILSCSAE